LFEYTNRSKSDVLKVADGCGHEIEAGDEELGFGHRRSVAGLCGSDILVQQRGPDLMDWLCTRQEYPKNN
jgi:hypothetical protein